MGNRTSTPMILGKLDNTQFRKFSSRISKNSAYTALFCYGIEHLNPENKQILRDIAKEFDIDLNTDEDFVRMSTELNERLFAPRS